MNLLHKRIKNFNKIVKNFNHEKISDFVVAHKINKSLFYKLQISVKKFVKQSKKYNFKNRTPNGKIVPKKEIIKEYTEVLINYRNVINSLNITDKISKWVFPVVRYKDVKIDKKFKNRPNKSELAHSDIWAGWNSNSLLIQIPILGDTKNNRVKYYEMPKQITKNWLTKKTYIDAKDNFIKKCKPLNHHYNKGYIYISDIIAVHKTIKKNGCKSRASIDTPLILKPYKFQSYGSNDLISNKEIFEIKKNYKLFAPLKMGEIDGIAGKKLPSTCKILKIAKS